MHILKNKTGLLQLQVKACTIADCGRNIGFIYLYEKSLNKLLAAECPKPAVIDINNILLKNLPLRPSMYDLLGAVIAQTTLKLCYVYIYKLGAGVFYTRAVFSSPNSRFEVDCKVSDAVGVALWFKKPVYITESTLKESNANVFELS